MRLKLSAIFAAALILSCGREAYSQQAAQTSLPAISAAAAPQPGQSAVSDQPTAATAPTSPKTIVPLAPIAPERLRIGALVRPAILVSRRSASFAAMSVDSGMQRIMAAHIDAGRFAVLNLAGRDVRDLPAAAVNGIAVDADDHKIFAAGEGQKMIVFDRRSLVQIDSIDLGGHADAITFDPDDHRLFVGHDGSPDVWVIDARTHVILGTVRLDGEPSYSAYDPVAKCILQNIEGLDRLEKIDPDRETVTASWPTAPAVTPHGLALDSDDHLAFVAGGNGVLAVIDMRSGAVLSSSAIASNVDQIAYDVAAREVFCASGSEGVVTVVRIASNGQAATLGDVVTHSGAHTLSVVDSPGFVDIWTCYADPSGSYMQCFSIAR